MSRKNLKSIKEKIEELMDQKTWKTKSFTDLKKGKRYYNTLKRAVVPETKLTPDQPDKICFLELIEFTDNKEQRFRFGYYIRYKTGKWKGIFNIGQRELSITKEDWVRLLAKALEEYIDLPDRGDVRFIKQKYRNELVKKLEQRNFRQLSDKEIDYLIGCLIYRCNMYDL